MPDLPSRFPPETPVKAGPVPWSMAEIAVLREKYGRVRAAKLAAHLKRTRYAVIAQARRQGLHEPRPR